MLEMAKLVGGPGSSEERRRSPPESIRSWQRVFLLPLSGKHALPQRPLVAAQIKLQSFTKLHSSAESAVSRAPQKRN